jgi:AbrB family looped-hinge helix DNA binding protein
MRENESRKSMLSENLMILRKRYHYSQETAAEKIGVSRQALAKWEAGESMPEIDKCMRIAELYHVSLDDLVNYSQKESGLQIPEKGKHLWAVAVSEKGQIVIPKKAREIFHIKTGSTLLLLGDESKGLAIVSADVMEKNMQEMMKAMKNGSSSEEE